AEASPGYTPERVRDSVMFGFAVSVRGILGIGLFILGVVVGVLLTLWLTGG
ncbi:unnamed protein product, partial [marine sediment metagenome]